MRKALYVLLPFVASAAVMAQATTMNRLGEQYVRLVLALGALAAHLEAVERKA